MNELTFFKCLYYRIAHRWHWSNNNNTKSKGEKSSSVEEQPRARQSRGSTGPFLEEAVLGRSYSLKAIFKKCQKYANCHTGAAESPSFRGLWKTARAECRGQTLCWQWLALSFSFQSKEQECLPWSPWPVSAPGNCLSWDARELDRRHPHLLLGSQVAWELILSFTNYKTPGKIISKVLLLHV